MIRAITLMGTFLREMLRQRTVMFSCFILPVIILWSTWWVTADIPMVFSLDTGSVVESTMIDVHLFTGALTAMAITAALFSFLVTAESRSIGDRLRIAGYSRAAVAAGPFLAILTVLLAACVAAFLLAIALQAPDTFGDFFLAVLLTTLIYAGLGALLGMVFPRVMEGSFIVLLVSFTDLMLISNPMGEGVYLQGWTYFAPGFWPTQIALAAGFGSGTVHLGEATLWSLLYAMLAFGAAFLAARMPSGRMRSD